MSHEWSWKKSQEIKLLQDYLLSFMLQVLSQATSLWRFFTFPLYFNHSYSQSSEKFNN